MRQKGEAVYQNHLDDLVGETYEVLIERGGIGRLPQFTCVETGDLPRGKIVEMRITGHNHKHLVGEVVDLRKAS